MDVVKFVDQVIGLGPGGGKNGGELVTLGIPAGLAKNPKSETAGFFGCLLK